MQTIIKASPKTEDSTADKLRAQIKKTSENNLEQEELLDVKFVPLLNDNIEH